MRGVRKRKYVGYNPDSLPTDEEIMAQSPRQREEFPLFTPKQLAHETRNVRLDISFEDVVKIRDQADMITEVMYQIRLVTKRHPRGASYQRVGARREAASCARALNILNGKQKAK